MKLINEALEEEVIAEFLLAEIDSSRFGETIIKAMGKNDLSLVTTPNLNDTKENEFRKQLLGQVRGYGLNKELFEDFPLDMKWYSAVINRQELQNVMYIDYSYWNELSDGTRLPTVAAKNIRNGVEIYGVKNDGFLDIHADYVAGKSFARLILIAKNRESRIVVLEGHARLTAYCLKENLIPKQLKVIIGYSEELDQCDLY